MATIEVNVRAPSAYSNLPTSGERRGPDIWDDRWDDDSRKTEVTATARITNNGTASGRAELRIRDVTTPMRPITRGTTGFRTISVGAGLALEIGGSDPVVLRTSWRIPNDEQVNVLVEVIDEASGSALETSTFIVNSYAVPMVSDLSASDIEISVA